MLSLSVFLAQSIKINGTGYLSYELRRGRAPADHTKPQSHAKLNSEIHRPASAHGVPWTKPNSWRAGPIETTSKAADAGPEPAGDTAHHLFDLFACY